MIAGEFKDDELNMGTSVGWKDNLLKNLHKDTSQTSLVTIEEHTSMTRLTNL